MVTRIPASDNGVIIKFGGGLHTRASEDEIDAREAAGGQNFLLDLENRELRNRPPYDLIGTVPNAGEIRGGASLRKVDGSVSLLIQADDVVYEWDGDSAFNAVGSVVSTAKLRGHWFSHFSALDDKVFITDLNLADVVKEWDGTTFQSVSFVDENDSSFGNFFAKYMHISNERAIFSNIKDPGGSTPHLIVGSEAGDTNQITVSQQPSSALSESDPFFLLAPDLKPINGHMAAFGSIIISTENGKLFNLTGASAKDFAFSDFYENSAAVGDESIVYIGNDIIYGRQGRIESVRDTDRFGDSEADDISREIQDLIQGFTGWTSVYNSRLNRVYLFPSGQSEVYVFQTSMRDAASSGRSASALQSALGQQPGSGTGLSPWMRWTTQHELAFMPTFVGSMLDPSDGLEYTFMGDASGNFYRLEGSGASGDAGGSDVKTEWLTKLISADLDAQVYDVQGWIKYRKGDAATVTLRFEYAGETAFNEDVTIAIPAITGRPLYNNSLYYNDDNHYGTAFRQRLIRQKFLAPGQANEFQVRVTVEGTTDFQINEIGIRLKTAS